MERVNVTLDPFSLIVLETLSEQSGMNRSEILRNIIQIFSADRLTEEEIEKIKIAAAIQIMERKQGKGTAL